MIEYVVDIVQNLLLSFIKFIVYKLVLIILSASSELFQTNGLQRWLSQMAYIPLLQNTHKYHRI